MNPLVTALLVLGYGVAAPTGFRLVQIVKNQHRMAFVGHQVGVIIAALGWAVKLSPIVAIIHIVWLIGTRLAFKFYSKRTPKQTKSAA